MMYTILHSVRDCVVLMRFSRILKTSLERLLGMVGEVTYDTGERYCIVVLSYRTVLYNRTMNNTVLGVLYCIAALYE